MVKDQTFSGFFCTLPLGWYQGWYKGWLTSVLQHDDVHDVSIFEQIEEYRAISFVALIAIIVFDVVL